MAVLAESYLLSAEELQNTLFAGAHYQACGSVAWCGAIPTLTNSLLDVVGATQDCFCGAEGCSYECKRNWGQRRLSQTVIINIANCDILEFKRGSQAP